VEFYTAAIAHFMNDLLRNPYATTHVITKGNHSNLRVLGTPLAAPGF
jgi:hypothetical protein